MLSAPPEPASTQPVTPSCKSNAGPSLLRPAWVWMSISPGATILPRASIVWGGVARDVGLYRDDLSASNRNVAYRIEPNRGVDDAPALDKEIVGRRESFWNVGEQRSATHAHELASVHHGRQPLSLDHRRGHAEKKSRSVFLVRSYLTTGIIDVSREATQPRAEKRDEFAAPHGLTPRPRITDQI